MSFLFKKNRYFINVVVVKAVRKQAQIMIVVSAKTRTPDAGAGICEQIFQNPYTGILAILSLAGGFLSFPVTYICHSRGKNIFGLFKSCYFAIIFSIIGGVGRLLPQLYRCISQADFLLRVCKRNEFYLTIF